MRIQIGSTQPRWETVGTRDNAVADDVRRAQVMATLDYPALVA